MAHRFPRAVLQVLHGERDVTRLSRGGSLSQQAEINVLTKESFAYFLRNLVGSHQIKRGFILSTYSLHGSLVLASLLQTHN